MKPSHQMFKILILGDSAVGKSCLLLQYCDKKFQQSHVATVGIDFKMKQLTIDENVIKMQLWDTAGQERFQTLASTLYKGAMGIALVYSVDNAKAFQGIQRWIKENSEESIQIVLIANKSDLPNKAVSTAEGNKLAAEFNIPFFEVSAMTGENVQQAFESLAHQIYSQVKSKPQPKEESHQVAQKLTVAATETKDSKHKSSKPCACG